MRLLSIILASALAAYALGFYLAVPANPEVKFWREVVERRNIQIDQVRTEQPSTPIIFFTGGSSCAFSIDPKIIEEQCGLPSFNLGLPVAAGRQYLLHQALEQTRPGDILIICLEPDLLTTANQDSGPTKLSFALATALGQTSDSTGGDTFNTSLTIPHWLNLTRPGAGYATTLAARHLARKPYRYNVQDIQYRGRILTNIIDPSPDFAGIAETDSLATDARVMLTTVVRTARTKGVRLAYSMPWRLTRPDVIEINRTAKKSVQADINQLIPVIDDGHTGTVSDPTLFSDSPLHLSAKGAEARSRDLAIALKQWMGTTL